MRVERFALEPKTGRVNIFVFADQNADLHAIAKKQAIPMEHFALRAVGLRPGTPNGIARLRDIRLHRPRPQLLRVHNNRQHVGRGEIDMANLGRGISHAVLHALHERGLRALIKRLARVLSQSRQRERESRQGRQPKKFSWFQKVERQTTRNGFSMKTSISDKPQCSACRRVAARPFPELASLPSLCPHLMPDYPAPTGNSLFPNRSSR